jgi:5-methylcytosine-specific restriction endonuclease McrA
MIATASTHVLVLNASYEPLHNVSVQHAVKMLVRQVAVVEETYDHMFGGIRVPKVLRLVRYVAMKWKYKQNMILSKQGILRRDGHRCAYCDGPARTIDHVLPKSRGGPLSWENAVAACASCNHRKANRTPEEAGMRLLFVPRPPDLAVSY